MNAENFTREMYINDVTLRDGEQGEKKSLTADKKVMLAMQFVKNGYRGIEAGNPGSNDLQYESARRVAEEVGSLRLPRPPISSGYELFYGGNSLHPKISALARCTVGDVQRALEAVRPAPNHGVHIYMALSEGQYPSKWSAGMAKRGLADDYHTFIDKWALPEIERMIKLIKEQDPHCHIRFSPEDAARTEPRILDTAILHAAKVGAHEINYANTLGGSNPFVVHETIGRIRTLLTQYGFVDRLGKSEYDPVRIAYHDHNDTGMAVANSFAAFYAGAIVIDTTVFGLGERPGNTAVEPLMLSLYAGRPEHERMAGTIITDTFVTKETMRTANLTAEAFEIEIPVHAPVVGSNQRQQRAGVHQAAHAEGIRRGVRTVYQLYDLREFGVEEETIISPESGWGGLKEVFDQMKLPYQEDNREVFVQTMKGVAQKYLRDLTQAEVAQLIYYPAVVKITGGNYVMAVNNAESVGDCIAVKMVTSDSEVPEIAGTASCSTEGVVDAVVHAMKQIIPGVNIPKHGFTVQSVGEGSDAEAEASVTIQNDRIVTGTARDSDTQKAIMKALLSAFNSLVAVEHYQRKLDAMDPTDLSAIK